MNIFSDSSKYYIVITACLLLNGCETISYYGQMVKGHLSILGSRTKIASLIDNEKTSDKLKSKFQLILDTRKFAEEKLLLNAGGNYLHYVDLERSYVVWNVFAAPEFSVKSKKWCYPIVGCASYHGYYHKEDAIRYADTLKAEGYDTYVGGVAAYSTLGWLNDPILNTFVNRSDNQLSSLIFHELAHQKLYINGDSTFNESFATVIAQEGLRRWINQSSVEDQNEVQGRNTKEQNTLKIQFKNKQQRTKEFSALIIKTRKKLENMYQSKLTIENKRKQKTALIKALRQEYKIIKKERWGNYKGYDKWFSLDINNAHLVTISTYHSYTQIMTKKLEQFNHDLSKFYLWCESMSELSNQERKALLTKP